MRLYSQLYENSFSTADPYTARCNNKSLLVSLTQSFLIGHKGFSGILYPAINGLFACELNECKAQIVYGSDMDRLKDFC